jgi:flagellar biogenesis protein FliO
MRSWQRVDRTMTQRKITVEGRGVAEWVLKMLRGWRAQNDGLGRQMQLVETLGLGGKRQLMLVSCDGERFLVGGGLESIETIVRVKAESSLAFMTKDVDELCR